MPVPQPAHLIADALGEAAVPGDAAFCNVAAHLPQMARRVPDHNALIVTKARMSRGRAIYETRSFLEFERLTNRYAHALVKIGVRRGMRTLMMVRPGVEFIGLTFALFKIGAVVVLIDPGMGLGRMLECIRGVTPEALVAVGRAHVLRAIRPKPFASVTCSVTVGKRWLCGGPSLDWLARNACDEFEPARTRGDETAAILFTSGATGPAKGVVYEHAMFDAQVRLLRDFFKIQPGEIDLPAFPLFALFNPALGMTSVIPDMDAAKPARVNPAHIVEAIRDQGVTNTFGSPAVWTRVADYCAQDRIKLPSLKRILIAGAPVSYHVIQKLHQVIGEDADVYTPYGATEALPIAAIAGRTVVAETASNARRGAGICVGCVLPQITLRIIRISDEPIEAWSDELLLPDGQIGEIVVQGPVVTKSYAHQPRATAMAKIWDGEHIWHRMGDVGYRDDRGRIWFCGRKNHRVVTPEGTLFSVPCEAIFNEHPEVLCSALVGVGPLGRREPVIIVQLKRPCDPLGSRRRVVARELRELARAHDLTRTISRVMFHRGFPVDVRHNAKINREALGVWAKERLR
ncbi:MAG: fatty acid CoA ligase family protein [Phycisphaerae bacterium]